MGISIAVVDAFTPERFAGNPAGICFPDAGRDAAWMQRVAMEMNLAETAFLEPRADGFGLRWFTPAVEMDLCGHATLASAHALWETGRLAEGAPARFHTRSGLLTCTRNGDWIEMDFPAIPVSAAPATPELLKALGVDATAVTWSGQHKMGWLLELDSEARVRALTPDFPALKRIPGVLVCATAPVRDGQRDFVSRVFGPNVGIDEDPVTGGAHCFLGPYWAAKLGKPTVLGHQVSARGGTVRVTPKGDRVVLAGQAVTVWRGELLQ